MWTRLWKEVEALRLFAAPPPAELVTGAELAALPPAARAMMAFFDVAEGKPKHWSFCIGWTGRFRRSQKAPWMAIEAVQYNTRLPVARIFHMKARIAGLPMFGRDTYLRGHGRMLGKVAGLFTVADGSGPEFDTSECVTWLDDAILFAPSMLLGPATRWSHVDERRFDVAVTDAGRTVTARVLVDDRGAPIDVETTDRFMDDPSDPKHRLVRGRWSTPVEGWSLFDGKRILARGRAIWRLDAGDFEYAIFETVPETLELDRLPVATARRYGAFASPSRPSRPMPGSQR